MTFSEFRYFANVTGYGFNLDCYSSRRGILKLLFRHNLISFLMHNNCLNIMYENGEPCAFAAGYIKGRKSTGSFTDVKPVLILLKIWYGVLLVLSLGIAAFFYFRNLGINFAFDRKLRKKAGYNGEPELLVLAVAEKYRRKGYANALTSEFLKEARRFGYDYYVLCTDDYCDKDYYFNNGYTLLSKTEVHYKGVPETTYGYLFRTGKENKA